MYNLDLTIEKIKKVVKTHYLGDGKYARYIFQDKSNTRNLGVNEYGCADAMNILYTLQDFPKGEMRDKCLKALLDLQDEKTGLFREKTHHEIHTTAHCVAALELFDEKPLYKPVALEKYFNTDGLKELLDGLPWTTTPWPGSHQGAGIYVIGVLTDSVSLDWQRFYFDYLYNNTDEKYGISKNGTIDQGSAPVFHHLNGWFHYMFNMQYAKKPLKYPDKVIDTCIYLYKNNLLKKDFTHEICFSQIDWIFVLNRAMRETPHRFEEAKACLYDFADKYIPYMINLDYENNDKANDLHMLFGAVCALAELQTALGGYIESTKPMRLVLDRRPFI